jgi:hypothetical protein
MSPAADRTWRRSATALRRSSEPALAVCCLLSGRSRKLPWRRMLAVNSGRLRSGSGAGAHLGPPRAAARVALSALAGRRRNGADRAGRPARADRVLGGVVVASTPEDDRLVALASFPPGPGAVPHEHRRWSQPGACRRRRARCRVDWRRLERKVATRNELETTRT